MESQDGILVSRYGTNPVSKSEKLRQDTERAELIVRLILGAGFLGQPWMCWLPCCTGGAKQYRPGRQL
jgi:hypothetical protein